MEHFHGASECIQIDSLHLTALLDGDAQFRLRIGAHRYVLDLTQHQHTVQNSAEHHMLAIEKFTRVAGYEKLAAVRILARVRHREQAGLVVLQREVLVWKSTAVIDRRQSGSVALHTRKKRERN